MGVGIVGRFRRRDTLDRALAEARWIVGELLFDHVGRERGDRRSGARQHAEEGAKRSAAQDRAKAAPEFVFGRPEVRHLGREDAALFRLAEIADDLADCEHADRYHDEADAVGELGDAEGEALHAGVHVGSDDAEEEPEYHHRQ